MLRYISPRRDTNQPPQETSLQRTLTLRAEGRKELPPPAPSASSEDSGGGQPGAISHGGASTGRRPHSSPICRQILLLVSVGAHQEVPVTALTSGSLVLEPASQPQREIPEEGQLSPGH